MRALLVANRYDADPGFVGEHLRNAGYSFVECHREHPGDWSSLDETDLVVSLGSDWSVYWEHVQQGWDRKQRSCRQHTTVARPF